MLRNLIVLTFFTLLAAGCGTSSSADDAQAGAADAAADQLRLAVIPKGHSHQFWQSVEQGVEQADAEFDDVTVEFRGPTKENDPTEQKKLFEVKQVAGLDGIAIAPADGTILGPAIDRAVDAGTPVVIFDSGAEAERFAAFVGTDNYNAGAMAGQAMVDALGGKGDVVVMRYKTGSVSTEQREQGFLDVIAEHDGITVLSADQEGANKEKQVAQNLLSTHGAEAEGVYTPNQSTTIGMISALREQGYYDKGMVHIGFDHAPEILASMQAGGLRAYVTQNPVRMGYLTVATLRQAVRGEAVDENVDTGAYLVTPESLSDPAVRAVLGLDSSE